MQVTGQRVELNFEYKSLSEYEERKMGKKWSSGRQVVVHLQRLCWYFIRER
jgi:hypothetical protein